ncbi:ABC transporter permease [Dethiobacter alkaliphilus]|uniref:ABC transporter permease n=1 Tax=Dethiobacter alkaliphilus TaxID=427926 RepID=UPI0022272886|nr:ABC transporter permease [Dethiobacter alkaliphilus]MCW3490654.1 ABC transporter permease [Dethiobacter alkaliphilus]
MKFALSIAWRFLISGKGQTLLILAGIAIGISVQLFIGLLINGLQISLVDSTIGNASQITVKAEQKNEVFSDWQEKEELILENIEGIRYTSPTLTLPAFISFDDNAEAAVFRGFQLEQADNIYGISSKIVAGNLPTSDGEVVVGEKLGDDLDLNVGDELTFFNFDGQRGEGIISGFFDLGVSSINESWVISTLETAQEIFERPDSVSALEIQVEDVFEADILAGQIAELLAGNELTVSNWKEANEELLSGLQGQDISSIMIQIFVVVAVVLGIASVLAISVIQRSKQIGILKAMGVNNQVSSLIFLFQGLILGIAGGILGVIIGLSLSLAFMQFAVNPDGSPVVEIFIDYRFILFSFLIAVVASAFAALIPARKSSRLEPIEVIRNG